MTLENLSNVKRSRTRFDLVRGVVTGRRTEDDEPLPGPRTHEDAGAGSVGEMVVQTAREAALPIRTLGLLVVGTGQVELQLRLGRERIDEEDRIVRGAGEYAALDFGLADPEGVAVERFGQIELATIRGDLALDAVQDDRKFAEVLERAHRAVVGVGIAVIDRAGDVLVARPEGIDVELNLEGLRTAVDHAPEASVPQRIPRVLPSLTRTVVPDHVFNGLGCQTDGQQQCNGNCPHRSSSVFSRLTFHPW